MFISQSHLISWLYKARKTARFAGFGLVLLALALPAAAIAEIIRVPSDVFGSSSLKSASLKPFPKWRGALKRYFSERQGARADCQAGLFDRCPLKEWDAFLASIKGLDRARQIREVNTYLNRNRYILDIVNWKVSDYWASPIQFMERNGDCEDYAIAKFMSLRALGFANEQMRIVVLRDLNLKIAHAVLVVDQGGHRYVLDNQIRDIVPDTIIRHYKPIYSVNETHWWLHRQG